MGGVRREDIANVDKREGGGRRKVTIPKMREEREKHRKKSCERY